VIRTSNPSRLELKHGKSVWIDAPAQNIINSIFGTQDEFLLASFIRQKTQSSIVFTTPGKQKEVISKLAASAEAAAECRKVVKQKIAEAVRVRQECDATMSVLTSQQNEMRSEYMHLETSLSGFTVNVSEWKKEYRSLKNRIRTQRKNEGIVRQKIQRSKHNAVMKNNLDSLRESVKVQVEEHHNKIRKLREDESEFQDGERLTEEHKFRCDLDRLRMYEAEYRQSKSSFELQTQARLDSLKSGIDPSKLSEYAKYPTTFGPQIEVLERAMALIGRCDGNIWGLSVETPEHTDLTDPNWSELTNTMSRWMNFLTRSIGIIESELPHLNRLLKRLSSIELNSSLGVMSCPKCSASLRCIDSKLCLAKKRADVVYASELSMTLIDPHIETPELRWSSVNELKNRYTELKSEWRVCRKTFKTLLNDQTDHSELSHRRMKEMLKEAKLELSLEERRRQQVDKIPSTDPITEKKKRKYLKVKSELRTQTGSKPLRRGHLHEIYADIALSEIEERIRAYTTWKGEKDDRDRQIIRSEQAIDELRKTLEDRTSEYERTLKVDEPLMSLQKRHKELFKSLRKDEDEYLQKSDEKDKVKSYVKLLELKRAIDHISDQCKPIQEVRDQKTGVEAGLMRLRTLIDQAEATSISNVVHTINMLACQYLDLMFDEPIHVELSAVTETQKGKIKYSPSVNVSYRGSQYGSVYELSGGEQDRISLAFILAVSEMTRSKILMLDECLSSISSTQNSRIVRGLESFAKRRPILVVQHNGIEGTFDSVIPV
jgi:DNA repair exonuclease SbcCD ATPase subunit